MGLVIFNLCVSFLVFACLTTIYTSTTSPTLHTVDDKFICKDSELNSETYYLNSTSVKALEQFLQEITAYTNSFESGNSYSWSECTAERASDKYHGLSQHSQPFYHYPVKTIYVLQTGSSDESHQTGGSGALWLVVMAGALGFLAGRLWPLGREAGWRTPAALRPLVERTLDWIKAHHRFRDNEIPAIDEDKEMAESSFWITKEEVVPLHTHSMSIEVLGHGTFGRVFAATFRGTKVAVKAIVPAEIWNPPESKCTSPGNSPNWRGQKFPSAMARLNNVLSNIEEDQSVSQDVESVAGSEQGLVLETVVGKQETHSSTDSSSISDETKVGQSSLNTADEKDLIDLKTEAKQEEVEEDLSNIELEDCFEERRRRISCGLFEAIRSLENVSAEEPPEGEGLRQEKSVQNKKSLSTWLKEMDKPDWASKSKTSVDNNGPSSRRFDSHSVKALSGPNSSGKMSNSHDSANSVRGSEPWRQQSSEPVGIPIPKEDSLLPSIQEIAFLASEDLHVSSPLASPTNDRSQRISCPSSLHAGVSKQTPGMLNPTVGFRPQRSSVGGTSLHSGTGSPFLYDKVPLALKPMFSDPTTAIMNFSSPEWEQAHQPNNMGLSIPSLNAIQHVEDPLQVMIQKQGCTDPGMMRPPRHSTPSMPGSPLAIKTHRSARNSDSLVNTPSSLRSEGNEVNTQLRSLLNAGSPTMRKVSLTWNQVLDDVNPSSRAASVQGEEGEAKESPSWSTVMTPEHKGHFATSKQSRNDMAKEVQKLAKIHHPNIITILGAYVDPDQGCCAVREFMDFGTLDEVLYNRTTNVNVLTLVRIFLQVSAGLQYLHEALPPVVHGEIDAANIYLGQNFVAKIGEVNIVTKLRAKHSKPFWTAPECLEVESEGGMVVPNLCSATPASDIFALGITIWRAFSQEDPYEDLLQHFRPTEILYKIKQEGVRPMISPKVPAKIQKLITECWHADPAQRPSIRQVKATLESGFEHEAMVVVDCFNQTDYNYSRRLSLDGSKSQLDLLQYILPKHVAEALSKGLKVEPENFDPVTIFFSDIVGYTDLSSTLPAIKVMDMLDRLYTKLDLCCAEAKLFKVETIGDAYMCVGGLPEPQEDHTIRVAMFAIEALNAANKTLVDEELPDIGCINLRVGFHSGPVVASVVGELNPRYCLFGDTVNMAARMESNSSENKINMSYQAKQYLKEQLPGLELEERGSIMIKGKGLEECTFLNKSEKNLTKLRSQLMLGEFESSDAMINSNNTALNVRSNV